MPYKVKRSQRGGFDIRNTRTGKTVGHSATRAKAEASVRARYAAMEGRERKT